MGWRELVLRGLAQVGTQPRTGNQAWANTLTLGGGYGGTKGERAENLGLGY